MSMATCPNCKTNVIKQSQSWKYGQFTVNAYVCPKCNTQFRKYYINGKHSFTLKYEKGKGFVKA
jgi:ssDNA-binding Zn-finger/Zn-ribbon topoisomerase 1